MILDSKWLLQSLRHKVTSQKSMCRQFASHWGVLEDRRQRDSGRLRACRARQLLTGCRAIGTSDRSCRAWPSAKRPLRWTRRGLCKNVLPVQPNVFFLPALIPDRTPKPATWIRLFPPLPKAAKAPLAQLLGTMVPSGQKLPRKQSTANSAVGPRALGGCEGNVLGGRKCQRSVAWDQMRGSS